MTPSEMGYRMPAEWERHERTLIAWPVRASMCEPRDYDRVCDGFRELICVISEFEPVSLVVLPEEARSLKEKFSAFENVDCLPAPYNDSWIRDSGPTFLTNQSGRRAGVNWQFNAWGGKYPRWDLDDRLAAELLDDFRIRRFDAPLVMEGGSFHVDGEGTLIATEQCLLNKNRNPQLNRGQIERNLQAYLGVEKVIWLKRGLDEDETDGHVDNVACFIAPGTVLLQVCDDPNDKNADVTRGNLERLSRATDAAGRVLRVLTVPQPPRRFYNGKRLTLSYINFYLVNGGVILPTFGGLAAETDREAELVLQQIFPDRRIRTIDGMALITEGGNVHCATQQVPAGGGDGHAKRQSGGDTDELFTEQ